MSFNVVFLGTAPFGFPVMRALSRDGRVNLKGVFTQPDRESGRGREPQSPPVADFARELDLPLYQPEDINGDGKDQLEGLDPIDFGIVIAYGQILSPEVLGIPDRGFFNFHASLLPRWRGASPIRHALMSGDETTGVTVFQVVEQLDAGPICVDVRTPIRENENYGQLYERLSQLNVGALNVLLTDLEAGNLTCRDQVGDETYASRLDSDAARVRWEESARTVQNRIRAFSPDPGAFSFRRNERIKMFDSRVRDDIEEAGEPGEILRLESDEMVVATGEQGAIGIREVQPAGSRRMSVESYRAGASDLDEGDHFDLEETVTS